MSKTRNYDSDGFVVRAACVCVDAEERQVLLVSSRRDSKLWIVPGGGVEEGEETQEAALREVREEAGVCGNITRTLGVFENPERRHRTSVYLLVVKELLQDWEEARDFGRRRQWFTVREAVDELAKHKPIQSHYLDLLLLSPTTTTTSTTTTTISTGGGRIVGVDSMCASSPTSTINTSQGNCDSSGSSSGGSGSGGSGCDTTITTTTIAATATTTTSTCVYNLAESSSSSSNSQTTTTTTITTTTTPPPPSPLLSPFPSIDS